MRASVVVVAAVFVTPAGCGSAALVVVDLETSLVPHTDFDSVRTELSVVPFTPVATAGTVLVEPVRDGESYVAGVRVAEFDALAPGDFWLRVSLLRDGGAVVAQRTTQIHVVSTYAVTIVVGDGPPRDAGPPDGGAPCSGASRCRVPGAGDATGDCADETVASCAPSGVVDCACGTSARARLFFDPPSGSGGHLRHVVVTGADLAGLTLQIDGLCAGGSGSATCPVSGPCPSLPEGTLAWVWPIDTTLAGHDLTTPGTHVVRIFSDDFGAPCDAASELVAAPFVVR